MRRTKEIWKAIGGYEGFYEISNCGNVRSVNRTFSNSIGVERTYSGKILKFLNIRDYYAVRLRGETLTVHRLVAKTFIPNPDNLPQVNHLNGVKTDNRVDNLEWCSAARNVRHAFELGLKINKKGEDSSSSKLSNLKITAAVYLRLNGWYYREIAEVVGVSRKTLEMALKGKSWKHLKLK